MATVRRDKLLRLAKAGRLVCVDSYHYDDMTGSSRGEKELPLRITHGGGDFKEGFYNAHAYDFSGHGRAYTDRDDPNRITVYVHSNHNFTVKIVDTPNEEAIYKEQDDHSSLPNQS